MSKTFDLVAKHESKIFFLFLLISLSQFWFTKYVPSLDGPQHLYNANVLVQLLNGSELFDQYFSVNDVLVGYWSGHFFLTFFKYFFPAWFAEKLFLSAYLISLVYAFRYFVRSLNITKANFVSYSIFLFAFHSYFVLGYYSFSIAATFLFLAFGYWIRKKETFSWKNSVVFMFILLGLFLSHGLVFAIFGLSFGIYFVLGLIRDLRTDKALVKYYVELAPKLLISVIPAIYFWYTYISHVMSINSTVISPTYTYGDLIEFLARIRQLVGFHHQKEAYGYIPLFALFMVLSMSIVRKKIKGEKLNLLSKKNAVLFASLAILGLYFLAPDRLSAGNLTNRFGLFFYLLFIAWLSVVEFKKGFQLTALFVLFLATVYTRANHVKEIKKLDRQVKQIESLADHIEPGSTIDYLQNSSNWIHLHFQLYLACDKEIIHIMNPQCQGQFPVVWDFDKMPRVYGNEQAMPFGVNDSYYNTKDSVQLDYISVFNYQTFKNDSIKNADMNRVLQGFDLEFLSEDKSIALFKNQR